MGIVDFIKDGVGELMVARPDATKQDLVFKHPDATICERAQLTIDADDAAVFLRDGSIVGTLRAAGAGSRHMLSTENIPFLDQLIDRFTGGDVFVADLYFVTMRPVYDQRFGGELGMMEDPMLGELVTPRIHGTYAFQVIDPEAFLLRYMGLGVRRGNDDLLRWVGGLMVNGIKAVLGQVLISEQKSMLQIMPLQQRLQERFAAGLPDLAEVGCRIVQIGDFNISLSDDDERRLQSAQSETGAAERVAQVANIGVAEAQARQRHYELDQGCANDADCAQQLAGGDFTRYPAGRAMIGAAEGMVQSGDDGGGGAVTGGAALGVGLGMAQAMGLQLPVALPAAETGAAGKVVCPSCSAQVQSGKFCAECGSELVPKPRYCSACGAAGAAGARSCAECGTAFPQG